MLPFKGDTEIVTIVFLAMALFYFQQFYFDKKNVYYSKFINYVQNTIYILTIFKNIYKKLYEFCEILNKFYKHFSISRYLNHIYRVFKYIIIRNLKICYQRNGKNVVFVGQILRFIIVIFYQIAAFFYFLFFYS